MNMPGIGFSADYNAGAANQCQQPSPLLTGQNMPGVPGTQGTGTMPSVSGGMAQGGIPIPLTDLNQPAAMTLDSLQYLNGFLRTQIGNRVRVEFLVGTNTFLDKMGKLLAVGANYIIIQEAMTDDLLVCDFFNIKFITLFR